MEPKFTRLVRRVRDTQESEIDCSACLDQIAQYVDLELANGEAERAMPLVNQHLHQCTVCFEEYQMLREMAQLEANGEMPAADVMLERLKQNQRPTE